MNRLALAVLLVVLIVAAGMLIRHRNSASAPSTKRFPFYGTVADVRDDGWIVCDFTHRKGVAVLIASRVGEWSVEWMRTNLIGKPISLVALIPVESPESYVPDNIITVEATIDGEHKARPLNHPSGRMD